FFLGFRDHSIAPPSDLCLKTSRIRSQPALRSWARRAMRSVKRWWAAAAAGFGGLSSGRSPEVGSDGTSGSGIGAFGKSVPGALDFRWRLLFLFGAVALLRGLRARVLAD